MFVKDNLGMIVKDLQFWRECRKILGIEAESQEGMKQEALACRACCGSIGCLLWGSSLLTHI